MKRITYIAVAALALVGLGIYASNAQNARSNNDTGVLVVEQDTAYIPGNQNNGRRMNNTAQNNNSENMRNPQNNGLSTGHNTPNINNPNSDNNINQGGFSSLPGNADVEVAPDNQPMVDKAMKNQNPSYNNGNPDVDALYEQEVIETID